MGVFDLYFFSFGDFSALPVLITLSWVRLFKFPVTEPSERTGDFNTLFLETLSSTFWGVSSTAEDI